MADPFAFGQHADIPWRLPEVIPPTADLVSAKATLERQLARVDRKHAAYCLAKLATAFHAKWAKDEADAQLEVWLDANGDLPNDLWSLATIELLQTHVYGMPKPVHLRAVVLAQFSARQHKLNRVQSMMGGSGNAAKRAIREPVEVRLRSAIWLGWKHGRMPMAVKAERDLARLENRAPAAWCGELSIGKTSAPERDDLPIKPDSPATRASLLAARARFWAKQGAAAKPLVSSLEAAHRAAFGHAPGDDYEPTGEIV